jgi:hypothetical protein
VPSADGASTSSSLQSIHSSTNNRNMSELIAESATDDDDEYYGCFMKASLVTVTKINQREWSEKTGGNISIGIKHSYRIDANVAGDHVRRYAQTWSSMDKSKACVKSFLYPSHIGTEDRAPRNEAAAYQRVVAPPRHTLGSPSRFRPSKKGESSMGAAGSQPTEGGGGDRASTAENAGRKDGKESQQSTSASGVQSQNEPTVQIP